MNIYDFAIIGGGVVGCAIARELARYKAEILLLERECDVCFGTSGRNSGVSHAGFYIPPNTLKAKLNVLGNRMLPTLCNELDVPFREIGKLVVAKNDDEIKYLEKLKRQGEKNGVVGLRIIDKEEIRELEPRVNGIKALYSPRSGILDPFELTIALAENAMENGVDIMLNCEVRDIHVREEFFELKTERGDFRAEYLINSSGLSADEISRMVGIEKYKIYPCRGEYHVLDKNCSDIVKMLIYPVPPSESGGLGVHLTPTVHGNLMLGPSAEFILDKEDLSTTREVMEDLIREAKEIVPGINASGIIRSFSGIRPKLNKNGKFADFVIKEEIERFINLVGIESPGLTAAPAIAKFVLNIIRKKKSLERKEKFKETRRRKPRFSELNEEERARLIGKDKRYSEIICRCELVTRREIIDSWRNPLNARSLNSIKIRTRAGMGRCQGSFCLPRIIDILREEFNIDPLKLTLSCKDSEMFFDYTRRENENHKC
ncbi:MAG: FAD/NAD(P)-binding oxidoreductase [Candidatus Altiarchaeales archaeon]|nr:MAG: FAD/NAD(P)-binding oxidoreductase [Candidatus Altiarchaeales archaeon]